jgi:hypothetical protein
MRFVKYYKIKKTKNQKIIMENTDQAFKDNVLGLEIFFVDDPYEQDIQNAIPSNEMSMETIKMNFACLLPENSLLFRFYIDGCGKTYVYYKDHIFMAQPNFQLHDVIEKNSILDAIFYLNSEGQPVVGVYDAKVLNGIVIANEAIIDRHVKMVQSLCKTTEKITNHWIGHAWICVQEWKRDRLPFGCSEILVFGTQHDEQNIYIIDQLLP